MKLKHLYLAFALLFVFSTSEAQNIYTVDNTVGSNAQYSDLQTAIASSSPGDTIYVHPSETSYGVIIIDKELHLRGFSHSNANRVTFIERIEFGENGSNSSFSGLHITGNFIVEDLNTTLTGLVFENNIVDNNMLFLDAGVDGMIIRGNIIQEIGNILYQGYSNTIISNNIITWRINVEYYQTVTIKNNLFISGNSTAVIRNFGNGSITVQNNIIYVDAGNNVDVNYSGVIFDHCLAYNIGSANMDPLDGTNNIINIDPLFISAIDDNFDAYLDDYHLQAGSVAIDAGANGVDMGLYDDSPFVFNNFGYTNNLPVVTVLDITNTIPLGGDVDVTIETKAN